MKTNQRTYIELSKDALNYNVSQIKSIIGQTEIAAVIKGNAYGHGMIQIASMLQENNNVTWLCTASLSEAITLKKSGITKQLLVLSYIDDNPELAVAFSIHTVIYNIEQAYAFESAAKKVGRPAYVHIKIDTGMSRLGVDPEDIITFIKKVQKFKNINIQGIFTHISDTTNPDQNFSYSQINKFDKIIDDLNKLKISIPYTHVLSSSGICLESKKNYSFIRAGALLFGLFKSNENKELIERIFPGFNLKPVLCWKTKIIQIKDVPKNTSIGYNRAFITKKQTKIATLPIGYYDGYHFSNSNKAYVTIKGQKAPLLGIVSMNLTTIDITNIKNVTLNDEVILIGQNITAQELAKNSHTITNEIVTRIDSQIPRNIVSEHQEIIFDESYNHETIRRSTSSSSIL